LLDQFAKMDFILLVEKFTATGQQQRPVTTRATNKHNNKHNNKQTSQEKKNPSRKQNVVEEVGKGSVTPNQTVFMIQKVIAEYYKSKSFWAAFWALRWAEYEVSAINPGTSEGRLGVLM